MIVKAPFTEEQVSYLNAYQANDSLHPFTCANRGNHIGEGILVATTAGWICPQCDYKQDWAHDFMTKPQLPSRLSNFLHDLRNKKKENG